MQMFRYRTERIAGWFDENGVHSHLISNSLHTYVRLWSDALESTLRTANEGISFERSLQ